MASNIMTDAARKAQWDSTTYAAVNYSSDALYFLLINTTGDAIADATKQGYTYESDFNANELAAAGNYSTRGMAPGSQAVSQASHVVKITSANPSWATATFTAYGVWMVKHLGTAAASPALFYYTFGGAVTATAGAFTLTPNAAGLFTVSGG